jgi:acetyl-CoA C-acetyltransferase
MPDAVIVSRARTPIGRARKGSLVEVDAFALARTAVGAAIERSGLPAADLDDIIVAETLQGGGVIARYIALELGLPSIPGLADNRHCAAGLSAAQIGASAIMAGMDRAVVAAGTESLSTSPQSFKANSPWMSPSHPATPDAPQFDMSITVGENTAREAGVTREASDEWALQSHLRAAKSIANGWFEEETVPVELPGGGLFTTDEHPRADSTIEKLAALPALHPELYAPTVTAGNASGLNDGAAAIVMMNADFAASHGLRPLARVRSWASVGVAPARTGMAPIEAIPKALQRSGLTVADVDLFEVNEAFCSVAVATTSTLGLDPERVNVNGSGCGLGHPIACTGTRMIVTMIGELERRDATIGVVSMCAGGGMGSALVLERV